MDSSFRACLIRADIDRTLRGRGRVLKFKTQINGTFSALVIRKWQQQIEEIDACVCRLELFPQPASGLCRLN